MLKALMCIGQNINPELEMFYTGQIQNLILIETVNVLHWIHPRKGPWMYLKEKSAVLYKIILLPLLLRFEILDFQEGPNELFKKRN